MAALCRKCKWSEDRKGGFVRHSGADSRPLWVLDVLQAFHSCLPFFCKQLPFQQMRPQATMITMIAITAPLENTKLTWCTAWHMSNIVGAQVGWCIAMGHIENVKIEIIIVTIVIAPSEALLNLWAANEVSQFQQPNLHQCHHITVNAMDPSWWSTWSRRTKAKQPSPILKPYLSTRGFWQQASVEWIYRVSLKTSTTMCWVLVLYHLKRERLIHL